MARTKNQAKRMADHVADQTRYNGSPTPSPPPSPTPPPLPVEEPADDENINRENSKDLEEEQVPEQNSPPVGSKASLEDSRELSSSRQRGSVEANEIPRGVMPHVGFYIRKEQYPRSVKIATRCFIAKAVNEIEKTHDKHEMEWFLNHPQFHHFFHMPRETNHKSMGIWMLIIRMACIEKKKELWFLVNGVPIRYSMREHFVLS